VVQEIRDKQRQRLPASELIKDAHAVGKLTRSEADRLLQQDQQSSNRDDLYRQPTYSQGLND
ncbi:unnamed protein product, partial [marine sediment metagenome]